MGLERRERRLKLLKSEIKMGTLLFYINKKDYKRVLRTTVCWAIWQQTWKRHARVSRDTQPARTEARRRRQPEQTGHWKRHRIRNNTSENPMQTRGQNWMASQGTSTKLTKRNLYDLLHTLPGDWRRRNTPKIFLWATVTPMPKPDKDTIKKEVTEQSAL